MIRLSVALLARLSLIAEPIASSAICPGRQDDDAPTEEGMERFLPLLRGTLRGCQRLRRVPFDSLGRRAFLAAQTTTELISSASSFTTTATNRFPTSFCPRRAVIVGQSSAEARHFPNSAPFAKAAAPATTPRGRRKKKRPKVKIASLVDQTSRRQAAAQRGKVLVRFYSRDGARGFLCKLDRGHVKAIGFTGLRGPVAVERFTIRPIRGGRHHKAHPCKGLPPFWTS